MTLPQAPRLATSLPTSAALSVRYLRHVPDTGSYVLRVSVGWRLRSWEDEGSGVVDGELTGLDLFLGEVEVGL